MTPADHVASVLRSIVLFHNAGEHTPEALPEILRWMKREGYEVVPISQKMPSLA